MQTTALHEALRWAGTRPVQRARIGAHWSEPSALPACLNGPRLAEDRSFLASKLAKMQPVLDAEQVIHLIDVELMFADECVELKIGVVDPLTTTRLQYVSLGSFIASGLPIVGSIVSPLVAALLFLASKAVRLLGSRPMAMALHKMSRKHIAFALPAAASAAGYAACAIMASWQVREIRAGSKPRAIGVHPILDVTR